MARGFRKDHKQAVEECKRLESLLADVVWYNFETACREWQHPWPQSFGDSPVVLHGARYAYACKRGRLRESGSFPIYYEGIVQHAPKLPPEIVLLEVQSARSDVEASEKLTTAPWDWAPGGRLYEQLLRESDGVREYERRRISGAGLGDDASGTRNVDPGS